MSYSIGIDYGTASGRVILVDTSNGDIISSYEETYPHSTIAESLYGKRYHVIILQNADDYQYILENGVTHVLEESQVNRNEVIGIGVDFTSCTIVFLDEHFEPLHRHDNFKSNPHAYVSIMGLKMKQHKWLKLINKRIRTGLIIMVQASIVNG